MKYWGDMREKFGFSDGEAVPTGVEHYRTAYILAVNAIAEKLGSHVRAIAFDRAGMHNWCLILLVEMENAPADPTEPITQYAFNSHVMDDAFDEAIELAMEDCIDSYVTCRVSLSKSARKQLAALGKRKAVAV